jgi:hypothetical protein
VTQPQCHEYLIWKREEGEGNDAIQRRSRGRRKANEHGEEGEGEREQDIDLSGMEDRNKYNEMLETAILSIADQRKLICGAPYHSISN